MKTTVVISDPLLRRAKRHARRTGRSLRALIEEGLQMVLGGDVTTRYELPDCSVGVAGAENPLDRMPWHELRDEIYGGR